MSGACTSASSNAEAFAPAAGKSRGRSSEVGESRAPECFCGESAALGVGDAGLVHGGVNYGFHRVSGAKLGNLLDITEAQALAIGNFAVVGRHCASENAQQGGFPGPVGSDEADAVCFGNGEGDILKQRLGAK